MRVRIRYCLLDALKFVEHGRAIAKLGRRRREKFADICAEISTILNDFDLTPEDHRRHPKQQRDRRHKTRA